MTFFGLRLGMLLHLYRRRLRAHPVAELLAGLGVAIGVALVFGVLLANASLTGSASKLVRGLAGGARVELAAASSQGFSQRIAQRAEALPGIEVAAPVLRREVTLTGPRGSAGVQLVGVTPSIEGLGGLATQEIAAAAQLQRGGLGLPAQVAQAIGVGPRAEVRVSAGGQVHSVRVRALLGARIAPLASSPVAVAVLGLAQTLGGARGVVDEVLVRPQPGHVAQVRHELLRLAAGRLLVRPATAELRLLNVATAPNRQSTSLFAAIAVMIGFLLALNAMLLTVPERRRFVAELRMQGYDARQVLLLLGFQALVLGLIASAAGIALGALLASALFQRVPSFLTVAFPLGAEETVRPAAVAAALGCGVLASIGASLGPLLDLRGARAGDAPLSVAARSELVRFATVWRLGLAGIALAAAATALALIAPGLTVTAGIALAAAAVCLAPALQWALVHVLPRLGERIRCAALIVAFAELRAITTRAVALTAIVALAVYGGVAVGGARQDLIAGIDQASAQYFSTAPVWVSSQQDVFNTSAFAAAGPAAAVARARGVATVRVYRGGLLDLGARRMWVRARPAGDALPLEPSQLLRGRLAAAAGRIERGGWAAVSSAYAAEAGLRIGAAFTLPTPSGPRRLRVAAIMTNSGWPAGTITIGARQYADWWGGVQAAALEVSLRPGVSARAGARAVRAALRGYPGLEVDTAAQRVALSDLRARQALRTLGEISTMLLLAAALAVACALSATIWRRRPRIAALKIHGYGRGQLWGAVLVESAITILGGCLLGALLGGLGHALASRFLHQSTGFPVAYSPGPVQALLTVALFCGTALAVVALPGAAAAAVPPRAALQE